MAQSKRREQATEDLWNFKEYFFAERGPQNVPQKFLKSAKWDNFRSVPGYYATVGSLTLGVEFNFEHLCWVDVRY